VPVSARSVATHLQLDYSLVKRVVRALVAWRILERTPDGLQVQPDTARWKPPIASSQPTSPATPRVLRRRLRAGLMAEGVTERLEDDGLSGRRKATAWRTEKNCPQ
jgi:hypothetical protein